MIFPHLKEMLVGVDYIKGCKVKSTLVTSNYMKQKFYLWIGSNYLSII